MNNEEINSAVSSRFDILNDRNAMWKWLIVSGAAVILLPLLIFLINVLALRTPDKIAFSIGSIDVAWYGIFIFIGFMGAIFISCIKLWQLYKVSIDPFYWFCLMGIPTAILGARLWSCILGDAHWADFLDFKTGGLAIEGGVALTVLLACWWFPFILKYPKYQVRDFSVEPNKVRQVTFLAYVDAIVPAILIGQIIGRYGNYQNQELYGNPIKNQAFATFIQHWFPLMDNPPGASPGVAQPLFLYESSLNWIGLVLIFFVGEYIPKKKVGDLGFIYFVWYGVLRLCLEPLRIHTFTFWPTYLMSSLWVFAGIVLLILSHTLFKRARSYSFVNSIKNKKLTKKTDDEMLYYLGR